VGLLDGLRRLDSWALRNYLRREDESAEGYLRRVSGWRSVGETQFPAREVHAALREFFEGYDARGPGR
jgi:hypothetical protein